MPYEMIINVNKNDLLTVLRTNRDKHRQVFLAALEGYRKHATRILNQQVKALTEGRSPEIRIVLDRPEDHTRDYDRVIGMIQMDQSETFKLDQVAYAQYVNDDWSWKRRWAKMSSSYATQSYTENYGEYEDDGDF